MVAEPRLYITNRARTSLIPHPRHGLYKNQKRGNRRMGFSNLTGWQEVVLLCCLVELVYFTTYFLGPNAEQEYMISDRIFATVQYTVILSVCLAFRLLLVVMYAIKYVRTRSVWVTTTIAACVVTFFGW